MKAIVLDGYGLNCGYETEFSLKQAGAEPERVHINELLNGEKSLEDFQLLAMIGGFSWGDDHGAGVLEACKLKDNLDDDIQKFIRDGKLIIGICNGFQALVNYGLLPGFDGRYDSREVSLLTNDCGNFRDQWIHLKTEESPCVFTRGIERIDLPVRHGEGKLYAEKPVVRRLFDDKQVVLRYANENGGLANGEFPYNPNGSLEDIAGVCDPTGRVFGLMPHPEAYNRFTNHPHWTRKKEELKRRGEPIPYEGDGIQVFRNAVEYIKGNLQ